jgi:hypothetical protein
MGMNIAPKGAVMQVNISVNVDRHFTVRYDASLFNSRIVRQAGNEMDIEMDRNRLSEMIAPSMACVIEMAGREEPLRGSILEAKSDGNNGVLTLKCRI